MMYNTPLVDKDLDWTYEQAVMSLSVKGFQIYMYTVYTIAYEEHNDGKIHQNWISPVMFNNLRLINDSWPLNKW